MHVLKFQALLLSVQYRFGVQSMHFLFFHCLFMQRYLCIFFCEESRFKILEIA